MGVWRMSFSCRWSYSLEAGVSLEAPEKGTVASQESLQGGKVRGGEEPDHVRLSEWRVWGRAVTTSLLSRASDVWQTMLKLGDHPEDS